MNKQSKKLYLLRIPELNICKIGISKDPKKRIKQLQTGCPYKLEICKIFNSQYTTKLETSLHNRFAHLKVDEEIHNLKGEYFNLSIRDVVDFEQTCQGIENNFNSQFFRQGSLRIYS